MFFILVAGYLLTCVMSTLQCVQTPNIVLERLIVVGAVELTFEIIGVIKIFKVKDK